jgi:FSR family fosmidomycin resistance protein-like MFS transporter
VGFAGDVLLIPVLERVKGLALLRWSSFVVLGLYVAWLSIGWLPAKYGLLALIAFGVTGWYQVLQGQAYAALPGRAGTVMAAGSLSGLLGSLIPLGLGLIAERFGLTAVLWLLVLGPISLIVFLPRNSDR